MPFFYFDTYYIILVVPAILIALWAQVRVKSTFAKYSAQPLSNGLTGAQAARRILDANGRETWNLAPYDFLAPAMSRDFPPSVIMPTPAPDTVNPSLWRQSQLVLRDGRMVIPGAPGLGIELNEKELLRHPYRRTELRHFRGDLTDIRPPDAVMYYDLVNEA